MTKILIFVTSLRTTAAARADIRNILSYSKTAFGPQLARDYLDGLAAAFDRIAAKPQVGHPEAALGDLIRSVKYLSHRIYYRVEGDGILVVRVLHHARDRPSTVGSSQ